MFEGTIVDIGLHTVTVLAASVLVAISYSAYVKKNNRKFMYVCMAFGLFCIKEILITFSAVYGGISAVIAGIHLLNLAILGLFFWGTVK